MKTRGRPRKEETKLLVVRLPVKTINKIKKLGGATKVIKPLIEEFLIMKKAVEKAKREEKRVKKG